MKQIIKIACVFVFVFSFWGCEKVIQIDLEDTEDRVVIEGRIYLNESTFVRVSRTKNFYEDNNYDPITDAKVSFFDEAGTEYVGTLNADLDFVAPANFIPIAGKSYSLKVVVDGKTYTASSVMQNFLPITSIEIEERDRTFSRDPEGEKEWVLIAHYDDPANESNFYLFDTYTYKFDSMPIRWNQVGTSDLQLESDELQDGKSAVKRFFQDEYRVLGDTAVAVLHHIDEDTYRYFLGLADVGGPPGLDIAPGNPESNIQGGALGYFGCFATSRDTVVIQ